MSHQHILGIDRIACEGRGLCGELLHELVDLDEWGYPITPDPTVPDQLLAHAKRAVAACPVLALRLDRVERPPNR